MQSQFWSLVRSMGRGRLTRVDDSGPVQLVQMQLSQGETLGADGIVIDGGGKPVQITNAPRITADSPLMRCTGDIECDGNIRAAGDILDNSTSNAQSMAGSRHTYDIHTHDVPHVQGGGSTIRSDPPQPQQ
jgi:phage gp45-like